LINRRQNPPHHRLFHVSLSVDIRIITTGTGTLPEPLAVAVSVPQTPHRMFLPPQKIKNKAYFSSPSFFLAFFCIRFKFLKHFAGYRYRNTVVPVEKYLTVLTIFLKENCFPNEIEIHKK
jgi:hypothetical protein